MDVKSILQGAEKPPTSAALDDAFVQAARSGRRGQAVGGFGRQKKKGGRKGLSREVLNLVGDTGIAPIVRLAPLGCSRSLLRGV